MFFYVDESGNTGNNLFDSSQPILSYGVLSSKLNPDVLAKSAHAAMLRKLSVDCLHANQLGVSRLTAIAPTLVKLQQRFQFRFDYYYIHKPTYALVILFDAIFDAGINPAVKWDLYWTPLRFPAIHKLSLLCDQELLENAWSLCIARDVDKRTTEIVALLTELRERSKTSNMGSSNQGVVRCRLRVRCRKSPSIRFWRHRSENIFTKCHRLSIRLVVYGEAATRREPEGRPLN